MASACSSPRGKACRSITKPITYNSINTFRGFESSVRELTRFTQSSPHQWLGFLRKTLQCEFDINKIMEKDCASCRIVGATAFTGLGVYTLYQGHTQLRRPAVSRRQIPRLPWRLAGVRVLGCSLIGLGIYRLFI